MPEGDTIYRTAVRLRQSLLGRTIRAARSRDPGLPAEPLRGSEVRDIESRGKHLLIHLEQGPTIHSHMGMTGSWHVYAVGEPWRKPPQRAALILELDETTCVCFSPKQLELLSPTRLRRHPHLQRLGPDILASSFDWPEIQRRFHVHAATPLGEAVMNQTIVCGIGNIYKSEMLFLNGWNPFLAVSDLAEPQLRELIERARKLMSDNLQGYPRRTRHNLDGSRLWVYGRCGKPCFRCGATIQVRRQGDLGRTTYWCPTCQPSQSPPG